MAVWTSPTVPSWFQKPKPGPGLCKLCFMPCRVEMMICESLGLSGLDIQAAYVCTVARLLVMQEQLLITLPIGRPTARTENMTIFVNPADVILNPIPSIVFYFCRDGR